MRNQIAALLRDRRRRQRGSVLSGVLIITAFVAIISGAVLTELSTNFLLSGVLVQRVSAEATLNSAMALNTNLLETQPIFAGCPNPISAAVNGLNASASYASCGPTSDTPNGSKLGAAGGLTFDGASWNGSYLVADSNANFYRYAFGRTAANWSANVGGSFTGPPAGMPDGVSAVVPVSNPSETASPGCGASGYCVAKLDSGDLTPDCYMPASAPVTASPAGGVSSSYRSNTYFGDGQGNVFAYGYVSCTPQNQTALPQPQPIVAGPIAFAGPPLGKLQTDELYLLASDSTGSQLYDYEFSSGRRSLGLSLQGSWQLDAPTAVGMVADGTTLPARLAITFASGMVQVVQVQAGLASSLGMSQLPAGISRAPAWCCGPSPNAIGVAGTNGTLYVLNSSATSLLNSFLIGPALNSTPAADPAGDWFVGADDGNIYEVPAVQSSPTTLRFGSGALGQLRSSVQVGACGSWLCAYGGSIAGAYLINLDARQVTMWACIGPSTTACVHGEPGLLTSFLVGSSTSQYAVHAQTWSFNSP